MEENNKKVVLEYEETAFNKKDIEAAAAFLSDNFKQHNPNFPDGKEGFKGGMQWLISTYPNLKVEVKDVIASGDKVVIHVYGEMDSSNPSGDKAAIVDIFRLENGKIAEHWDVLQTIPAEPKNSNSMF